MTVAITCSECGSEVVFLFDGETAKPRQTCDECSAVYELNVRQVMS